MITVLATNHLAYRGTLTDMCGFLGVCANGNNNKKIKEAINRLVEKKYILSLQEGRMYTLTLSIHSEQTRRIERSWILNIKDQKEKGVSWITLLKVFIYLTSRKTTMPISYEKAGHALGISARTVQKAVQQLDKIKFDDYGEFEHIKKWEYLGPGEYKSKGQEYNMWYRWSK